MSIEITCDAPSYFVVQATKLPPVCLQRPEDVRWLRGHRWLCWCGAGLPQAMAYRFTYDNDDRKTFSLSQCPKCLTVYWEERGS